MPIQEPAHMGLSVTQRINGVQRAGIKGIKQPRGGYLPVNSFEVIDLGGGMVDQAVETVSPGIVGIAVDYLSRVMTGATPTEAFHIPLLGVRALADTGIDETATYEALLAGIDGLTDESIICACRLAGYDAAFRAGVAAWRPADPGSGPDAQTIQNIRTMVERAVVFFEKYGPVKVDGPTFSGGYTDTVSKGDGDFITEDTLWDFKVSKQKVNPKQTLQILMYYLLWRRSENADKVTIEKLGLYNPRQDIVYLKNIADIPADVINEVDLDIIGYDDKF